MISSSRGRRGSLWISAAVALLLASGCSLGGSDSVDPPLPPGPSPAVTSTEALPAPTPTPTGNPSEPTVAPSSAALPVLPASVPVWFQIDSIGAGSFLLGLGLQDNGTLEVPPGEPGSPAAWYTGSPTPGEAGPSVLLGHVNATDAGPGVFAGLRQLKVGDTVEIAREDGSMATFSVYAGEQYPKDAFPTEKVYGNTEGAELRLITCDGYNPETGEFDDNYVVYAQLI